MPYRTTPLVNNEYYHIYNRGVDKMAIFKNSYDFQRFLKTVIYYQIQGPKPRFSLFTPTTNLLERNKKIVDIICYCMMPNHFHFLLRQLVDGGITEFISRLSNSYTKYFNIKKKRVGHLLQGGFKSELVQSNEQLLHLSRYIHLNPLVSNLVTDLRNYPWSSYLEYIEYNSADICTKEIILNQFKSIKDYQNFVLDQASYGRELELIKHKIIVIESPS